LLQVTFETGLRNKMRVVLCHYGNALAMNKVFFAICLARDCIAVVGIHESTSWLPPKQNSLRLLLHCLTWLWGHFETFIWRARHKTNSDPFSLFLLVVQWKKISWWFYTDRSLYWFSL